MTVVKTNEDGKLTLTVEGYIDTANSVTFEQEVGQSVEESKNLVIDFENVEYISSSGLRVLLRFQKKISAANGEMVLKNLKPSVKEVFDLTGFSDILTIK